MVTNRRNCTYTSTHHWSSLLKRQPFREETRTVSIRDNILRKSSIMLNTSHLLVFAEPHVRQITFAVVTAASAVVARMSEVEHADTLADFPALAGLLADSDDSTHRLV